MIENNELFVYQYLEGKKILKEYIKYRDIKEKLYFIFGIETGIIIGIIIKIFSLVMN